MATRIQVSIDETVLRLIDAAAASLNPRSSRSDFLAQPSANFALQLVSAGLTVGVRWQPISRETNLDVFLSDVETAAWDCMAYEIGSSFRRAVREISTDCLERYPQLESVRVYRVGDKTTFTGYTRLPRENDEADEAMDRMLTPT